MRTCSKLLLALAVVIVPIMVQGADWPQWGGPAGNAVSPEMGLLKTWPKGGPELVWTYEKAGTGYSAPVVVNNELYMTGARGEEEYIFCLTDKLKETWSTKIGKMFDFQGNTFSGGPNASPAIRGDYLVALGSQGEVVCVHPATGKEHWRKNLPRELGGVVNPIQGGPGGWGFAASPRIDGDQVIVTPGGAKGLVAALELKTGKVLWQSKDVPAETTYAAPVLAEVNGVKMVIAMTQDGAVGVSAKNGDVLWTYKVANPYPDVVCTSPLVKNNQVYLTVGYGPGADFLELVPEGGKFKVKEVWSEKVIGNNQGGVVLVDKHVYGFHGKRNWVCQEWATGNVAWSSPRNGLTSGSVIYADGKLICLSEQKGEVVLVEASPEKYNEVSPRFTLPKESRLRKTNGRVWTHPVLSNGLLYLRDQGLGVLLQDQMTADRGGTAPQPPPRSGGLPSRKRQRRILPSVADASGSVIPRFGERGFESPRCTSASWITTYLQS